MKYTYLALIGHTLGQAEIPSGVGTGDIGFLDSKDPSARKPAQQQSDQSPPGPYGKHTGNIGSQSNIGKGPPISRISDMPYGPLWSKQHAWETAGSPEEYPPGYVPPKSNIKNDYQDMAGEYTGTLTQRRRKHQLKKKHHHHKSHHRNELLQTGAQGFPVYVNPESVLYPNTIEKFNFAEEYRVGLDDVQLLQTDQKGYPVYVNPESVLYPNLVEKYDFGQDIRLGPHDVSFIGTDSKADSSEKSRDSKKQKRRQLLRDSIQDDNLLQTGE